MQGKVIAMVAPTRSGKTYLTKRIAEYLDSPALFEVTGDLPERIQESLSDNIRQWERHLYFRGRALTMQREAHELAKTNPYVFVDSAWVSCRPYIDVYDITDFERSLLVQLSELDMQLLPWPDALIVLSEDDATSKKLWRLSGKDYELDETYFREQLLVIKHSFERYIEKTSFPVPTVHINRSGMDFDTPSVFESLLEQLKPIL